MLIGGHPAPDDIDQILELCNTLPSVFANTDYSIPVSESKKCSLVKQLYSASTQTLQSMSNMISHEEAIETAIASGDIEKVADLYKEIADAHFLSDTLDQYQEDLEKQHHRWLYKENSAVKNIEEMEFMLALAAVHEMQGNRARAIDYYSWAYELAQGPLDEHAYRVEQNQVGIVKGQKIGTDNIRQCVAVIIHDPETKQAALAHVDFQTNIDSLSKIITKRFLPTTTSTTKKLDIYLIGGGDRSPLYREVSDENIKKAITILCKYVSIDLKAADIGDKCLTSAVVFDSATAVFTQAVPHKTDETTYIRKAYLSCREQSPDLFRAFNLAKSSKMKIPGLTDVQCSDLLDLGFCELEKQSPPLRVWHTNQVLLPLLKAGDWIKKNRSPLVKPTLKNIIAKKTGQRPEQTGKIKEIYKEISPLVKNLQCSIEKLFGTLHSKLKQESTYLSRGTKRLWAATDYGVEADEPSRKISR